MADITAQLIWYRLKEVCSALADSCGSWWNNCGQGQLRWSEVDILDMLFLGWVVLAFVVVGLVNVYLKFFGLPTFLRHRIRGRNREVSSTSGGMVANTACLQRGGESVEWINLVLGWLHENHVRRPGIVDAWLKAAELEANKHMGDIRLKFDTVQMNQGTVKFTNVKTDSSTTSAFSSAGKDDLTIHANVSCCDIQLTVSVITRTATNLHADTCDVRIVRLHAPVTIRTRVGGDSVRVQLSLESATELNVAVTPGYSSNVDKLMLERAIKATISKLSLSVELPSGTSGLLTQLNSKEECLTTQTSKNTGSASFGSTEPSSVLHTRNGGTSTSEITRPVQSERSCDRQQSFSSYRTMITVQKLLVKVIKANGLMDKDFSHCDPYLCVSMDEPRQEYLTSVVKNTANPFFDEHFVFDFNVSTMQLVFLVYDKRIKREGEATDVDEFLGQAKVSMEDVRRLPSSRQIIPLTGRPKGLTTSTSGSVTVEFLFMDVPVESTVDEPSSVDSTAPYRRIETSHSMTPGGTLVTTTTTTTERLRDFMGDPMYHDSPIQVEKAETLPSYSMGNRSPLLGGNGSNIGTSGVHRDPSLVNGQENLTAAAFRELSRNPAPLQSSTSTTIVITGVQRTIQPAVEEDDNRGFGAVSPPKAVDTRKKSFASQLKKRFTRSKKNLSHSADKVHTLHDDRLLKPPSETSPAPSEEHSEEGSPLRKSRSHSLSSSFRNLFRRKKKHDGGASRDSSTMRLGGASEYLAETSTAHPSPQTLPKGSIARHNTPISGVGDLQPSYPYSSSVPARPSPLSDR